MSSLPDLIRKYSLAGPRYTSYPPATLFTPASVHLGLEDDIAEDNVAGSAGPAPLSLYFHLPFCESQCWFCGCNTVITRRREAAGEYLDLLAEEVRLTASRMNRARPVTQIHLGGGTPTFFPPDQLRRLGALIRQYFSIAATCEFGVEVDPRRLTAEHVQALREIGANRASLGVQDTNPAVQLAIHRFQPQAVNEKAVGWLRAAGFGSINVDLIFGLPRQTAGSFARTIDDVLDLAPDRLSVFSYAHVPWVKPAQRIFDRRAELPATEEKLAMFLAAHEKLGAAGYIDIGLDHFARPEDSLARAQANGTLHRNFQGYSTQADTSLYGFGISAISSTATSYRQNFKTLEAWTAAIAAGRLPIERGLRLTAEDERRRTIIMRLMCDRRLDFRALSTRLGLDFAATYADELASLEELEADGLLQRTPDGFEVTPLGAPLLRIIAMRFDPTVQPGARRHALAI